LINPIIGYLFSGGLCPLENFKK